MTLDYPADSDDFDRRKACKYIFYKGMGGRLMAVTV